MSIRLLLQVLVIMCARSALTWGADLPLTDDDVANNRAQPQAANLTASSPLGMRRSFFAAGDSASSGHPRPSAFAFRYEVVNLGVPPGGATSLATAINDQGQVVGVVRSGFALTIVDAFFWVAGIMELLPRAEFDRAVATGLNRQGQIVGTLSTASTPAAAEGVRWTRDADMWTTDLLGDLGGSSFANDINDIGLVVGTSCTSVNACAPTRAYRAQVVDGVADLRDLGALGGNASGANAINNLGFNQTGQIVGEAELPDGTMHAFVWPLGQQAFMTDLGTLDDDPGDGRASAANDINSGDRVIIVGRSDRAVDDGVNAVAWVEVAEGEWFIVDLGTLGGDRADALAVNDFGQVVGASQTASDGERAFVASTLGPHAMVDLNMLIDCDSGWLLRRANDINNAGAIVGGGELAGQSRAFLLTPLLAGDCDNDQSVNLFDWQMYVDCMDGPGELIDGACGCFDLDCSGSIDLHDAADLAVVFTQP